MLTFTSKKSGTYQKLRLINEVKTYVTYLIANSKADIAFFSNIELGHSYTNPHLHTQLWCDDKNAVRLIYDKVVAKFGLVEKRCSFTEPQHIFTFYNYVLKDYSEDLNDNRLWNIETAKRRMREKLRTTIRFYSKSKGKYTQKAYRYFYRAFGVLRGVADEFMDYFFSIFFKKERVFKLTISSFITIKNKGEFVLLRSYFLSFEVGLEILFYSPANDPPFDVHLLLSNVLVVKILGFIDD